LSEIASTREFNSRARHAANRSRSTLEEPLLSANIHSAPPMLGTQGCVRLGASP
jgi:hypothetical protein